MNLVEEKQRGLMPPGLQSWPLQLIEHFSNTTSVVPPPAGPAGCRPLYLLHLLNLSFKIRAPNGGCILQPLDLRRMDLAIKKISKIMAKDDGQKIAECFQNI